MNTARWMTWIAVVVLLSAGTAALYADGAQTGTIEGRVLDAEGSPLPGVTINLSGPQGQTSTVTDEDGAFRFGLLVAGDYTVGATLEGLGSKEVAVPLGAGLRQKVDLTLGAATTETITVTSEAPLVNKLETTATTTLEGEISENLSFVGRNVQSSLEVLPGVVQNTTSRLQGGIQLAVNGGNSPENAGYVDGVDTSFAKQGGGSRIFMPTTSLTETRLETAGFSAEYGRVVAGVTSSVIKSGTNEFHGDFLYIPQNEKWRAPYEELEIPRDDDIIDSFETSLGGPIVRDRAWFFASYGKMDTNEADVVGNGTRLNVGFRTTAKILKLNFQPSNKHQLQLSGVDAPMDKVQINQTFGDEWTPCDCSLDENLATLTWSFAMTDSAFLEAKVATQEDSTFREPLRSHPIDPTASPESPAGNNFRYQDQASGLVYNFLGQGAGQGHIINEREQANASVNLFRGSHDLKFGADYQDVTSATLNVVGTTFRGQGFNPSLPGGFVRPTDKRVFDPTSPVETAGIATSAYAQDRFDVTDKFNLYLGVRMDQQSFDNDSGVEVESDTDFMPRLAATYDVGGNGLVLVKATAGRYYQVTGQDVINENYATKPNGSNQFTQFSWNPATLRYDGRTQRTVPLLGFDPGDFDPYYKDEASLGVDWQFVPAWAFKVRGTWWEIGDAFWATNQFNAAGVPVLDVRNWDDGFREYEGVQLELNRAFRDNWTIRTNLTLGDTKGNNFGNGEVSVFVEDLFEGLGGIDVATGRTDATIVNREGVGNTGRSRILNVVGLKQFLIGSHTLGLGGYLGYRSGERWGLRVPVTLRHPVSLQTINSTTYIQPRDAEQLEDTHTLNLSGHWLFPIAAQFKGRVGVEAVNVTNEQEVTGINVATGERDAGKVAFQAPREYRFQIGVTF
jgi:hypothetical protein